MRKKITYFYSLLLMALFLLPWSGTKAETLTVADGTATNVSVPICSYYFDMGFKAQIIYPATDLGDLEGGTISGIKFYSSTASQTWSGGTIYIKIAEVEDDALTTTWLTPTFTDVYSGSCSIASNEMSMTFTTNFTYSGENNLLIEVGNSATSYTTPTINFYGVSATAASHSSRKKKSTYSYGDGVVDFRPKTTFTYTPGTPSGCPKPKNLAKDDTKDKPDAATFTWEQNDSETTYQWACVAKDAEVTSWNTLAENVRTIEVTALTSGTSYDFHVRSDCGSEQSANAKINFTPTCPAPTYGANPVSDKTHNSATVTWNAATGITKYQYVCVLKNATPDWTGVEAKVVTSAALSNLNELTEYDFYVRSWYSATAQSAAVKTSFTTNADCSAKTVDALHDWTEDFTNQATNAMPSCWTAAGNTSAVYVASSGYVTFSTGKALYFTGGSGTEAIAILPEFSNDLNTLQIAFSHIEESNTKSGQIKLGYYKNSAFQSLKTYDYSTSWKNESAYALSGVPEGARLAFSYTPVNSAWTAAIDNITVSLAPACAAPTNLTVGEISTTSAQVSWTSDADNFALQYKADTTGAEWVNATGDNITSPFTLNNLKPNETPYLVRVKAICTSSESDWVTLAQPFKTDCEAKSIGWSENFEGDLPCWSKDDNWTVYTWSGHSGSNSMRFNASAAGNLVLPAITLNAKAQLSFWHSSTSVTCSVYANSVSDENKIGEFAYNGESWKKDSIDLSAFNGQTVTLIIRGNYVADKRYLYIDDVAVTELPTCEAPTDLKVMTVGAKSARFFWTSSETAWKLKYKAESEENWTEVAVNENPYTLEGLSIATNYQATIQAACGSEFIDTVSFSTWCELADAANLPLEEDFAAGTKPACFQFLSTTAYPQVTSNKIWFQGTNKQIVVLPGFNIELNKLSIKFDFSESYAMFELGYFTAEGSEFQSLGVVTESGAEIDLSTKSAPNAAGYLAIRYNYASSPLASGSVDNIRVRKTPTCLKPVIGTIDPDYTSAIIPWDNTNATMWNLQYKTGSADWTTIVVSENPYTLENLAQGTTYKVRVQGICSDEESDFSDEAQFTTDCETINALPFTETFDAALSNCWIITDDNATYYAHSVYGGALVLPGGRTNSGHLVQLPTFSADLSKATLTIEYGFANTPAAGVAQPQVGYIDGEGFHELAALSKSANIAYVPLASAQSNVIAIRYDDGTSEETLDIYEIRVSRVEIFNDEDDNEARFTTLKAEGATINDFVLNRTLLFNGDYNTFCLPFDLSAEQIAESPLADFKLKAFDYASVENEELLLAITDASSIEAGKPYFIAYEGTNAPADAAKHIFHNVVISADEPGQSGNTEVTLKAVFDPATVVANAEHTQLFLAAGNTIYWPTADKAIKGFRAYFIVNEGGPLHIKAGMPARIVEHSDVTTGCENVNAIENTTVKFLENNQVVIIRNGVKYNIQGQVISK